MAVCATAAGWRTRRPTRSTRRLLVGPRAFPPASEWVCLLGGSAEPKPSTAQDLRGRRKRRGAERFRRLHAKRLRLSCPPLCLSVGGGRSRPAHPLLLHSPIHPPLLPGVLGLCSLPAPPAPDSSRRMGRKFCGRSARRGHGEAPPPPPPPPLPLLRGSLPKLDEDAKARDSGGSAVSLRFLLDQTRPAASEDADAPSSPTGRRATPAPASVLALAVSLRDDSAVAEMDAATARMTALVPVQTVHAAVAMASEPERDSAATATRQQRECQICFDQLDALQAHECATCCSAFCTSCTRWYIEFKVLEGEVSDKKLVCPAPQCTRPLPEEVVEAFLSPGLFDKYKTFLRNQRTGIRFCPRAGCCAVLDEPLFSTHRRVACAACARESCMRCGDAFHAVPLCRRVDKRLGRWKKRHDVSACPGCKTTIEKNGGCAHMKCVHCEHEFCWSCRRPWHSHDETLCLPLTFLHSKSNRYGCWAPMRVVTKTAVAGAAVVVAVAGVGVAVVVLPPLLAVHFAKESYRRGRFARDSFVQLANSERFE